ncbi:P-loop containing nucleoside triphosphate hydrolase protein, partial [Cyathus striatus]
PPKFLIFFDDINESIATREYLCTLVPPAYHDKIKWFNADMSDEYKEDESQNLLEGHTWGMCTTDSFGMGMDLPDIGLVVQWRATCSLTTLWQRIGRAAHN